MTRAADLPLHPAPPTPPANLLLMVVSGIVSLFLWLGVIGQFTLAVPRFARVSGDFRMKLPLLTEWVVHQGWWIVFAVAIASLFVCLGVGRRSLWPWLFLLFLLPLAVNAVVGASLYFPYMDLLEGLEGGAKK